MKFINLYNLTNDCRKLLGTMKQEIRNISIITKLSVDRLIIEKSKDNLLAHPYIALEVAKKVNFDKYLILLDYIVNPSKQKDKRKSILSKPEDKVLETFYLLEIDRRDETIKRLNEELIRIKKKKILEQNKLAYYSEEDEEEEDNPECIYVLEDVAHNAYKLGYSSNVTGRIKSHKTSNPFIEVVRIYENKDREAEKEAHRKISSFRLPNTREWYKKKDIVLSILDNLLS